jgi:hypothetical protein
MYEELKPKWIIEDGCLVIGKVLFHVDLTADADKCVGGGYYHCDVATKTFHLYGTSDKFGSAPKEAVMACISTGKVGNFHDETRYADWNFTWSTNSGYIPEQQTLISKKS